MSLIRSHNLSIGVVGLPNSGKSTIFNAITKSAVPAENYPFCTIDKNVGVIKIPDPRLEEMSQFFQSEEVVPSAMTFVDIAGLVKGASKGEGLGNKFLGHIREANCIMYVLRAFKSEEITHVYERVDPVDDLKIVRSELILKDIETVERKLNELKGSGKSGKTSELELNTATLEALMTGLSDEIPAFSIPVKEEAQNFVRDLWLLTDKPAFYVLNVRGGVDEPQLKEWASSLQAIISPEEKDFIITIDCKLEIDLTDIDDSEKGEITSMVEDYHSHIDLINMAYKRLNLLTFYTGSKKETNAWTITKGATIKEAAGAIHTDLEENFVAAEVINVEKLIEVGGWVNAKEKGLIKNHSRDYLIQDGDYINVLVNK